MLKKLSAVIRLNIRLQLTDPASTLILTAIPLIFIPFMSPAFKSMLVADGYADATGVEQAVPSMAVLFSFLSVQIIINSFINERMWGTWPRLAASATPRGVVLTGKALVAYLLQFVQVLAVLVLGALAFGYRPKGSVIALLLAVLAFSAVLAALGVAIALWAPSHDLALSLSNIIGMLAAGIGGAFCTVSSLPDWAQRAARFSPAYWAIDAIHSVSLDGAGVAGVLPAVGVLALFFAGLAALAMARLAVKRD